VCFEVFARVEKAESFGGLWMEWGVTQMVCWEISHNLLKPPSLAMHPVDGGKDAAESKN
jgi:hypothetical protein